MIKGLELALDLLILVNLAMLAAPRLTILIRLAALQGVLLGLVGILVHDQPTLRITLVVLGGTALKAGVFPWLIFRTYERIKVKRAVEPIVGYNLSVVIGVLALLATRWIGARIPLPPTSGPTLAASVSMMTIFTGLFLIVTRRKALTQVLGYLILENGIYLFGVCFASEGPIWVELGVLLDLLVAVLVMGIAVHRIDQEFASIDTARLRSLHD